MADRQFIDFRNDSLLDSLKKSETNFTSLFSLAKTVKLTANKTVVTYGEQGTTEGDTILLTITPRGFDLENTQYQFVVGDYTSAFLNAEETTVWELPDNLEPANEQSIVVTVNVYENGTDEIDAFDSVTITGIQGLFEGVVGAQGPAGADGVDGVDGADGRDAISVKLIANRYAVRYNEAGTEGDDIFFETEIQGVTNPSYRFLVDGVEKQFGKTSTFNLADSSEPEIEGVVTVKVELYLNDDDTEEEILASDAVSIYAVQDGSDALTVILTNDSHTLPVGPDDTINFSGSGTDVIVFQGGETLTATDETDSSLLNDGEFLVNASVIDVSGQQLTIGTKSVTTDSDGNSVLRFGDHSGLESDSYVQIKYSVVIRNLNGILKTVPRVQTLSKANAGLNAKVAKLLASQYVIRYSESGSEGDSISLEVDYQGYDELPYFYFYINGSQTPLERDDDQDNEFLLPDEYEPSIGGVTTIRVELSETVNGTPTAFDSISIYGVQDGSDAITAFLTNPTHVVPTDENGVVDTDFVSEGIIQGAGGTFKVFVGATDVTTQCAFTISPNDINSAISTIGASTGIYNVVASTFQSGNDYNIEIYQVTIPSNVAKTNEDVVIEATYSIAKSRAGISPSFVDLTNESVTLAAQENGDLKGSSPYTSTTVQIFDRGELQDGFIPLVNNNQKTTNNIWTVTADATGCTGSFTSKTTYEIDSFDKPNDNATVTFTSEKAGSDDYIRVFTINKARDAARSLSGYLTNESHAIPAEFNGATNSDDYASAGGQFVVFLGDSPVSSECTFQVFSLNPDTDPDWISFKQSPINEYEITSVPNNRNTAVLRATYQNFDGEDLTIDRTYSLVKSLGGATGADAKILKIEASGQAFIEDKDGQLIGDDISFTVDAQNIDLNAAGVDITWTAFRIGGTQAGEFNLGTSSDSGAILTKSAQEFGDADSVKVIARVTENEITYTDSITVYRIKDGIPATIYQIVPSVNLVRRSEGGTPTPSTVSFDVNKIVGADVTSNQVSSGTLDVLSDRNDGNGFESRQSSSPYTINAADISIRATFTVDEVLVDQETIPIVADGPTGATGSSAKVVKLTSSRYAIEYTDQSALVEGDNGQITLTASAQNFEDAVYTFTETGANNLTVDGNTATYTFTDYFSTPVEFRVGVAESDDTNTEIAFDTINVYAVKPGADGDDGLDGYTVIMTNESHVFPANSAGVVDSGSYGGSGTSFLVYKGATALTPVTTTPSTGEFKVTGAATYIVIDPDPSVNTETDEFIFGDHSGFSDAQDVAWIDYSINVEGSTTFTRRQSFTKSKAGIDSVITNLTNDNHSVPADSDGNVLSGGLSGASTTFTIFQGGSNVTSDWSVSISVDGLTINESTGSQSSASSHSVSVADFDENSDSGTVTFNATNSIYSPVSAVFTVTKVRGGADGSPAVIYRVVPSASVIGANNENTIHTPSTITFTAYKTEGQATTKLTSGGQLALYRNGSQIPITSPSESAPQSDGDLSYEITDNTTSLTIKLSINTVVVDEETIPVVLDGDQGAAGTDAKVVKLTSSRYAIEYDVDGNVVDNTTITLTATSQNFSNGFFKFTGGGSNFSDEASYTDGSGQNSDTASFSPPSSYFSTPLEFRVGVADGDQEEDAFDTISIYAVKPAADGADGADGVDAYTVVMSNESHTIPTNSEGTGGSYTGSGTTFSVYKGANQLQAVDENVTPTTGQFTAVMTNEVNINGNNNASVSGKNLVFSTASQFAADQDTAYIEFTVKLEGNTNTVVKRQSFSKSKQGVSGNSIKLAYKRNSTEPSSPSGGTLSTPPTGWYYTISAANSAGNVSDILWQSSGTFDSNGDNISWEQPQQFIGLDGAAGKNSWAIFIESATTPAPATPSGGDEDTAPAGWSFTPPSDPTNPLWVSYGKYNDSDVVVYTTPSKYYSRLAVSDLLTGTLSVQMNISAGGNIVNDTTVSSGNYSTTTSAGYYLSDDGDFFIGSSNSDTSNGSGTYMFFDSSEPKFDLNGNDVTLTIGEGNSTTNSTTIIDNTGIFLRSDYISGTQTPKSRIKIENDGANPFINLVDNVDDKSSVISTVAIRLNDDSTNGGKFSIRASSSNTTGGSSISSALGTSDPALFTGSLIRSKRGTSYSYSGLTYSDNYTFFHSNGVWLGTRDSNVSSPNPSPTHFIDLNGNDGSSPYLEIVDVGNLSTTSDNKIKIGATSSGGYIEFDGGSSYYLKPYSTGISLNVAGKIQASEFLGNLDGNASTATTATNADKVSLTEDSDDTSTYVVIANNASTSAQKLRYSSVGLKYDSSNNRLGINCNTDTLYAELTVKQADNNVGHGIKIVNSANDTNWEIVQDNNALYFGYSTALSGNWFSSSTYSYISNSTGTFVAYPSDIRLKNKIRKIENAIDKVKSIEGFHFQWNEIYRNDDKIHVGVSAQDVNEVLPEAVGIYENPKMKSDYLYVDYEKLVPLLIEAIKEQQTQIESLQEQINALSGT